MTVLGFGSAEDPAIYYVPGEDFFIYYLRREHFVIDCVFVGKIATIVPKHPGRIHDRQPALPL